MDEMFCGSLADVYGSMVDFAGVAYAGLSKGALLLLQGSVEGTRAVLMEAIRRRDSFPDTRRCVKSEMARNSNQDNEGPGLTMKKYQKEGRWYVRDGLLQGSEYGMRCGVTNLRVCRCWQR